MRLWARYTYQKRARTVPGVFFFDVHTNEIKAKSILIGVGFEPTPPKRLVPETSALDRSAIQPFEQRVLEVARTTGPPVATGIDLAAAAVGIGRRADTRAEQKNAETGNRTQALAATTQSTAPILSRQSIGAPSGGTLRTVRSRWPQKFWSPRRVPPSSVGRAQDF